MNTIRLSIIIPAYNVSAYIERCIESVLSQNTEKVEILLIDDGSTDNTGQICDRYQRKYNSKIQVFHKQNEGLSEARNDGIRKANGEYVLFLDGDDFLVQNALKNILNKIEQRPQADVIIGRYVNYFLDSGKYQQCDYQLDEKVIEKAKHEDLLLALLCNKSYNWYAVLNIVRKDYIVRNKLFFKKGVHFEDSIWTPIVIVKAERAYYLNEPFYVYVRNRTNAITSLTNEKTFKDKISVCRFTLEFSQKYISLEKNRKIFIGNSNQIYVSLLADIWKLDKKKRKGYWKELKNYRKTLIYSGRRYQKYLYCIWNIIGVYGVSIVLFLRAEWVRRKVKRNNAKRNWENK